MSEVGSFLLVIGKLWLQVIISPVFLVLIVLVGWQYRRMQRMSQGLFPTNRNMYIRSTLLSTLVGIAGGVAGSAGLLGLGVDLARMGIAYLFITAILLMLIHPRFLCFAYAGGIISVSHLVFGWPDVSVPQLMGLVAVLHMVESMLIYFSGHIDPMPVYVQTDRHGVVGGFNLQKFWPIPLVAVMSVVDPRTASTGITLPDWWRAGWWALFHDSSGVPSSVSYVLLPIIAILGYGEVTTTASPRQKSKVSARNLFCFSLMLLILSVMASRNPHLCILPALFGPLGHELVIWLGIKAESEATPSYVMPERGVMILEVLPGSTAAQAGLKRGDVVVGVNGLTVNSREEMEALLRYYGGELQLKICREGQDFSSSFARKPGQSLGIVLVPDPGEEGVRRRHAAFRSQRFLNWLKRFLR
ncbi:MAG: PDZ domain-containing protein [Syntrophothermus sp.]|uniref:PDZ domain-containing protein n=1 Tax=Syntrophothermus sp. TaxID=2736299 RepID=UPI00257B057F|nr:PDZ domain-containing protein [Syntrophothermus sp.]NSW83937.1 PDZ domain-containing protein [Syntrophothermus sp.]